MSWMVPSVIATLVDTLVLAAVYLYIYLQYRERFMGLWTVSWFIYSLRLAIELVMLFTDNIPGLLIVNQILHLASGLFLIWGAYLFIDRAMPKIWAYLFALGAIWVIPAVIARADFLYITFPVFSIVGAAYITTGSMFILFRGLAGAGRLITGWAFVAWGLHKANYPFVRPIEWLAPWGYLLAALLEIAVAIGMLLIYYQKVRGDLSESNERFRSLFENNHAVMLLIDPETGMILDANPAAAAYYGWSRDRLRSMKITDINTLPPEQVFNEMQKARAERRNYFHFRHRISNGSVRDVEVYSGPIRIGDKTLLYSIVHDETRRRKAEDDLRTAMTQLTALIENMREGILFEDTNRKIALANKAFCDMFGISARPESLIGADSRGAVLLAAPMFASPELFAGRVEELVREGVVVSNEKLSLTDGRVFERDYVPIYSHGSYLGHLWQYRDITEQKNLQDQLRHAQKMEAIGTLAGGVAHDFNNIITAIVGYGNLLKMNLEKDGESVAYLEQILTAADRAAALTKSLLAFSRKQPASLNIINVGEVVGRVLNLLRRLIGEDIELKAEVVTEGLTILGDTVHIEQVLMNLATNARDAMPKGGMLTIKTGRATIDNEFRRRHGFGKPGEYAFISVSDTGVGIDQKIIHRIFEPFFTTKEIGKGTGLGLAVVYGIVKQHAGYITCESEPGRGATFTIYLPLVQAEARHEAKSTQSGPLHGSETVLVAEDDATVRRLTKKVLEEFGYNVIEAEDGEDALKKMGADGNDISIVILDMVMPKKGGMETYEEIRRLYPSVKSIFMSGYAPEIIHKQDVTDRGLDMLLKPISPHELLTKVRTALDRDKGITAAPQSDMFS